MDLLLILGQSAWGLMPIITSLVCSTRLPLRNICLYRVLLVTWEMKKCLIIKNIIILKTYNKGILDIKRAYKQPNLLEGSARFDG
ncbi:hypothetical protein CLU79DRAFT_754083 [Phycomyces nitens]|nr:hypothetical protein CLU79DRAFT_754083 [Phycomyces nitens]